MIETITGVLLFVVATGVALVTIGNLANLEAISDERTGIVGTILLFCIILAFAGGAFVG